MAKARSIPGLRADLPFAQAAAATVRVRADELFEHAAGVLDTEEIERVHAMRVATRRLRAVLEIYAPCFPRDELKSVLREVKDLADALGGRRDPDVQLEGLERFASLLPAADQPGVWRFMTTIRAQQQEANEQLAVAIEELDHDGLRERLDALIAAADALVPSPAATDGAGA